MIGPEDPAPAGSDRLRAGHADREWVIETLKDAFVQGRRPATSSTCGRAGRSPTPAPVRRPLARAAARSGICLVIAAAAVRVAFLLDPDRPDSNLHQSWAPLCLTVAFLAVLTALGIVIHGVGTAVEQRPSRRRQEETQAVTPMEAPPV